MLSSKSKIPHISLIIASLAVLCDQLSKHWAVSHLDDGHVDHLVWTLQFNLSFNSGMAFGQGQGFGPIIGLIATVVVIILVLSLRQTAGKMSVLAVGLVIGGAIGNIVDRLFRGDAWLQGEVVDFIDFQWFPIFNIADICVDVGGGLLLLGYLKHQSRVRNA